MRRLKFILVAAISLVSTLGFGSDVEWTSRLEGQDISNGTMTITDGDFDVLLSPAFVDIDQHAYIRLGLTERVGMQFTGNRIVTINLDIIPYTANDTQLPAEQVTLTVEYSFDGTSAVTVDGSDYRMPGTYKFEVIVDTVIIFDVDNAIFITEPAADYVFLEAGIRAERYYVLDTQTVPDISAQMIHFDDLGNMTEVGSPIATDAATDEIYLNWDYVDGAEYYDLEWTWVDNYGATGLTNIRSQGDIDLTDQDFKNNSTRIRTSAQYYRIPQIFSKGYVIFRVRGVGRWQDAPEKDLYGEWSSPNSASKLKVDQWEDVITIINEHEELKNWQYQATYAEDGKKKEVTQYFDGSLRGRQTVTRINSDNHSVVGETVYDNEGRGVIQILPVPQENPAIRYYPQLNVNSDAVPYYHGNFDWEDGNEFC
ncbi:MAG: hypothetical protein HRT57_12045, partial [Crocinitomicaceae bacterium]|nr:hypothetical protein [Crocinitomicaceae bacterium]